MTKKSLYLILCILSMSLLSCRKVIEKSLQDPKSNARMTADGGELTVDVEDDDPTYSTIRYTVVGDQYTFPFKTDILKQAWNNLSPNPVSEVTPTHRYIRFNPQNLEEYALILNSGLKTFDFPLDHYIQEYGDVIANTSSDGLPALYTFAPIDAAIPNVTHEVLFSVRFISIESIVAEEAFNICGLSEKYPYYRDSEPNPQFDDIPVTVDDIPIPFTGWDITAEEEPYDGGDGGYNNGGLDFNTPTPSDVTNACNCTRNGDDRMPSGCVLVEETQFAPHWAGVRNVMVDFVGPFGQYQSMHTNDMGCFRSDNIMRHKVWRPFAPEIRLPVVMRVLFTSGTLTVRSLIPGTVALASKPVCHIVGDVAPWGLNNVTIRYNRATNAMQVPCVYYNSASINNSHYEVNIMGSQDGLGSAGVGGRRRILPTDMAYLVHPFNGRSGSAMMMRQLMKSGNPVTQFNQARIQWIFHAIPVIGFTIEPYLRIAPPDIAFGIDHGGPVQSASDIIRTVFYHEMAHAIHYQKSGRTFYQKLVSYEVNQIQQNGANNDPYGDGTANDAGVCALAEAWAEHIGITYAHRRYGVNHIFGGQNTRERIERSWYASLEGRRDGGIFGSLNYTWIPEGFLHDLMDNNIQNNQPPNFVIPENAAIGAADNVGGFTNLRFYDELDANDIGDFINRIRTNQLPATGNSVNSYNTLINAYGY